MRNDDLDMVEARNKPPMLGLVILGTGLMYLGIALLLMI
jgi:hypothetical protein